MALFPDYETTPVERALLNNFLGGTDLMQKIEDLERGYARLRKVADRDHEVVLEVIDTVGIRLDTLYPTPDIKSEECRTLLAKALQNHGDARVVSASRALSTHLAENEKS